MTTHISLQQAVGELLLPASFLRWSETLPEKESVTSESTDLLLKYLQQHVDSLTDIIIDNPKILVIGATETFEVPCPRWLRWFLFDLEETPSPVPNWKVRYLLLKAVADDLRMSHERNS